MEKRLRSSLQSSAEEFLCSATKLALKSSKSTLKTLIHSISASSPLSSSFPLSLHTSISESIISFQTILQNPPPASADPEKSPPSKRLRRWSRKTNSQRNDSQRNESNLNHDMQQTIEKLQILVYVTFLCVSHPKKALSPSDLLPAVQSLHDNLILFELDSNLSSEVASLCEEYWEESLPGREMLISQFLPFLLSRSLTLEKKVDVHRVYSLRDAFTLFDFDDKSIEDLKSLLIRCLISPLYLKTDDGRKFLAFMFGLSRQLLKEALALIKSQIPFGRKSILEAYGEILFKAWKGVEGDLKEEIENGFLQHLVEGAIHASSRDFAASIRRVLAGFITQRIADGVEKLLFRLSEPVIFRSLQVANSNVRLNALHILLDMFPLEDPEATKEVKDTLLDKQFFLLEKLFMDDCPDVRVVAVEGCCRILHLFWEIIPSSTITKMLTKILDCMSHDTSNEVRLSTLHGIVYLLGNLQSHEILKVLLPRLGHLIFDNVLSVRVAVLDLLLLIRDIRTFQFNKVVGLDALLSTLANDQAPVAQKITRLLMSSYFSSKLSIVEACNRCVTLIKRSPMAGARFCEFAVLEGASLKSLMELVRVLISLVLSHDKPNTDETEGILLAAANLCKNLSCEPSYRSALKELFDGGKGKCLFAVASTGRAQSFVLNIFSTVSPSDATEIFEECMHLVTNCSGLSENLEMQVEVKSAHKLLLSCDGFDDMFVALTRLLQKTAYRCHVKFGTEIPIQGVPLGKRKKCKSAVKISSKWKHGGKNVSCFEEDYSIAVGISWQIKDLLALEETRKAILVSQDLELPFLALKLISDVSIMQCICCEYMDTFPLLAYTALALHMTLQNISLSCACDGGTKKSDTTESSAVASEGTVLGQTAYHLLNCVEKLLEVGDVGASSNLASNSMQDNKKGLRSRGKHRDPQTEASSSNDDGSLYTKEKRMLKKVKMLTAVLKFLVDSIAMGFLSNIHGRCLNFTSAYIKHIIFALGARSTEKLQFKDNWFKEIAVCLKSSFSYGAKLLNLVLKDATDASPPPTETNDLANNMIDLMASVELSLGTGFAARLVAAAKPWLPDFILALGSGCIHHQFQEETTYVTALDHIKLHFPSWPTVLAKIQLSEAVEVSLEEEDNKSSEPQEFPTFKKFMEMMVALLKLGNRKILDAVGVIFLTGSVIGLERKDFGLMLGLLRFVCLNLIGQEDREWSELDMMLTCLPDIYPQIEREFEEQTNEELRQKLHGARELLEPVWLYHIYETGRFCVMEE